MNYASEVGSSTANYLWKPVRKIVGILRNEAPESISCVSSRKSSRVGEFTEVRHKRQIAPANLPRDVWTPELGLIFGPSPDAALSPRKLNFQPHDVTDDSSPQIPRMPLQRAVDEQPLVHGEHTRSQQTVNVGQPHAAKCPDFLAEPFDKAAELPLSTSMATPIKACRTTDSFDCPRGAGQQASEKTLRRTESFGSVKYDSSSPALMQSDKALTLILERQKQRAEVDANASPVTDPRPSSSAPLAGATPFGRGEDTDGCLVHSDRGTLISERTRRPSTDRPAEARGGSLAQALQPRRAQLQRTASLPLTRGVTNSSQRASSFGNSRRNVRARSIEHLDLVTSRDPEQFWYSLSGCLDPKLTETQRARIKEALCRFAARDAEHAQDRAQDAQWRWLQREMWPSNASSRS